MSIKYLFSLAFFFSDFKLHAKEQQKYYSYIDLMLNAQSFAVYFKIFGYKADMQFIPDYYWKKKSIQKVTERRQKIRSYWWRQLSGTELKGKTTV